MTNVLLTEDLEVSLSDVYFASNLYSVSKPAGDFLARYGRVFSQLLRGCIDRVRQELWKRTAAVAVDNDKSKY